MNKVVSLSVESKTIKEEKHVASEIKKSFRKIKQIRNLDHIKKGNVSENKGR